MSCPGRTMEELQKSFIESKFEENKSQSTCYIRTTWMLSAKVDLKISAFCQLHFMDHREAKRLGTRVRTENTFARNHRGVHFYTQRARDLEEHTVIVVFLPGVPKEISEEAEKIATNLEKIAILSSTIAMKKIELQKRLGICTTLRPYFHFSFSPDFYSINSKLHSVPDCKGIIIDDRFLNRFFTCGFGTIVNYLYQKNDIAPRVSQSIDWLFDSRTERRHQAAVVKTATALESLLIFNETEYQRVNGQY